MDSMKKPGDLVFVEFDTAEDVLPGWATIRWIEAGKAKVAMDRPKDRPPLDQLVPLEQLRTPEEVPQQWAARILGLELTPSGLDKETGRMRAGLFARRKDGRYVKLMIPGKGCDDSEPYTIDRGSAVGCVFLDPNDGFKYLRYEGVGISPTDLEAEDDAVAMYGPVWGPIILKTRSTMIDHLERGALVDDRKPVLKIAEEAMSRVVVPESVRLTYMTAPVDAFMVGDEHHPVVARTQNVARTNDPHVDELARGLQRVIDGVPRPCTLALYVPCYLMAVDWRGYCWATRFATIETSEEVRRAER